MNTVLDTTFSGKDISSATSIYEYTAQSDGVYSFQVRLASVAGDGNYEVYLTLNDGDAQTDDIMEPKTITTLDSGQTSCWFQTIKIPLLIGDVINVFVKGLAGDTNESGSIRIFSENYSTAMAGTITHTYTVTSSIDSTPIADVAVYVYTDSGLTNLVAYAITNNFGNATFYLDAGTYYFVSVKSGYSFDNPDTEVVS